MRQKQQQRGEQRGQCVARGVQGKVDSRQLEDKKRDDVGRYMVEAYGDTVLEKQLQTGTDRLSAVFTGQVDGQRGDEKKVDDNNCVQRCSLLCLRDRPFFADSCTTGVP